MLDLLFASIPLVLAGGWFYLSAVLAGLMGFKAGAAGYLMWALLFFSGTALYIFYVTRPHTQRLFRRVRRGLAQVDSDRWQEERRRMESRKPTGGP